MHDPIICLSRCQTTLHLHRVARFAAGGAVKTEIEDADELALCVVIPAPPPPQQDDPAPTRRRRGPQPQDPGAETTRRAVKTRSIHEDLQAAPAPALAADDADIPASVRRYRGYVSRRRPVTGAERQLAMELAYAFRSPLPYCVIRMSTMHVYYSSMMVSTASPAAQVVSFVRDVA